MANLMALPVELLLMISAKLEPKYTLTTLSLVNQHFHAVFNDEFYLQDMKEHGRAGFKEAHVLGQVTRLRKYIELGDDDIKYQINYHESMYLALDNRQSGILELLASKGVDMNQSTGVLGAPMQYILRAIRNLERYKVGNREREEKLQKCLDVVSSLIKCGVDVNHPFGLTITILGESFTKAVEYAVKSGEPRAVQILLDNGADAKNYVNWFGCGLLHIAAKWAARTSQAKWRVEMFELLIGAGCDIGFKDRHGRRFRPSKVWEVEMRSRRERYWNEKGRFRWVDKITALLAQDEWKGGPFEELGFTEGLFEERVFVEEVVKEDIVPAVSVPVATMGAIVVVSPLSNTTVDASTACDLLSTQSDTLMVDSVSTTSSNIADTTDTAHTNLGSAASTDKTPKSKVSVPEITVYEDTSPSQLDNSYDDEVISTNVPLAPPSSGKRKRALSSSSSSDTEKENAKLKMEKLEKLDGGDGDGDGDGIDGDTDVEGEGEEAGEGEGEGEMMLGLVDEN